MMMPAKQIILCGALAGLLPAFSGCSTNTQTTRSTPLSDTEVFPDKGGKIDPNVTAVITAHPGLTAPSEGTLGIPITSFSSGDNGQTCFPSSQGWNKYYVTFYFLGPNVNPAPNPNNYPNPENVNSITVDTLL